MRFRLVYCRIACLMVKLLKIIWFMFVAGLRACIRLAVQMWYKNKIHSAYDSLSRTKKLLIFGLVLLVIFLYIWPSWLTFSKTRSPELLMPHRWLTATDRPLGQAEVCLESKLDLVTHGVNPFNVIVNHEPLLSHEKHYFPFVGNGYIASGMSTTSPLFIRNGRTVSQPVHFYPIVDATVSGFHVAEGRVIHIFDGIVHRTQCFHVDEDASIVISSVVYAHRSRPSTLVQEIRIHNPTDKSVAVDVRQIGVSAWTGAKTVFKQISTGRSADLDYSLITGSVSSNQTSLYAVVIANVKLPDIVTIKPNTAWTSLVATVVKYEIVLDKKELKKKQSDLSAIVLQEFADVMNVEARVLRQNHSAVWNILWSSGFGISVSMANGALNGDKINATMYYVLSHAPSPIYELSRSQQEKSDLEKLLYFPDRCYDGHHTLQNDQMWRDFTKIDDIFESALTWLLTLHKQGCAPMLQAGADGVLQAMMLSYGALKFANNHLEFGTHPRDLHRDYFFRRINYGNDTHVNISVLVGEDNKAALYVSLDRNNRPYYACDAGCLDTPEPLNREVRKLPVKLTEPLTPILYITADKQHMEELKLTIHVKSIAEAPAHEQHVMVLHKHGHNFGGLPMLFWGSIGLLIFVFHLFLFKLIYNEYCSASEQQRAPRYQRHGGRYV